MNDIQGSHGIAMRRWMLFPVPTDDIFHRDPTAGRILAMMPFYIPFLFSNA
jgi:hypothetical protein